MSLEMCNTGASRCTDRDAIYDQKQQPAELRRDTQKLGGGNFFDGTGKKGLEGQRYTLIKVMVIVENSKTNKLLSSIGFRCGCVRDRGVLEN